MFTKNILEGQVYFTAIEYKKNAILTTGKKMAGQIAFDTNIPIIVVSYGKKPPHDTGDFVIVSDEILNRCKNIVGERVEYWYEKMVGVYVLKKGG